MSIKEEMLQFSAQHNGFVPGAWQEEINVSENVVNNEKYNGHGGGDYAIMEETCRYFNGDDSSVSITSLDDSINSHLVVYAAEKSNKEKVVIKL